jgi:hypothetical protein
MAWGYITHWTDGKWLQHWWEEYSKLDLKGTRRGNVNRITWLWMGASGLYLWTRQWTFYIRYGKFLDWLLISYSRRTLLHGVSTWQLFIRIYNIWNYCTWNMVLALHTKGSDDNLISHFCFLFVFYLVALSIAHIIYCHAFRRDYYTGYGSDDWIWHLIHTTPNDRKLEHYRLATHLAEHR